MSVKYDPSSPAAKGARERAQDAVLAAAAKRGAQLHKDHGCYTGLRGRAGEEGPPAAAPSTPTRGSPRAPDTPPAVEPLASAGSASGGGVCVRVRLLHRCARANCQLLLQSRSRQLQCGSCALCRCFFTHASCMAGHESGTAANSRCTSRNCVHSPRRRVGERGLG